MNGKEDVYTLYSELAIEKLCDSRGGWREKIVRTRGKVIPQNGTPNGTLFLINTSNIPARPNHNQKSPFDHKKRATKNPKNLVIDPASGSEKNGVGRSCRAERSAIA